MESSQFDWLRVDQSREIVSFPVSVHRVVVSSAATKTPPLPSPEAGVGARGI